MWYLFGRSSVLTYLRKQNLSISGVGVFFVAFLRVKTTKKQCILLFADPDFVMSPLLAFSFALAVQEVPSAAVLTQLHELQQKAPDLRIAPSTVLHRAGTSATSETLEHQQVQQCGPKAG
jgi:hypothetical protein